MIMCDSSRPGLAGGVYTLPYNEAVDGKRHGHMTRHGVNWTRNVSHPQDPRCPECKAPTQKEDQP